MYPRAASPLDRAPRPQEPCALEMRSTVRAAWQYFLGNRQGGSTLTQQLARTLFLKKEDSLQRPMRISPNNSLIQFQA